jgi:hypothetical protein
VNKLNPMFICAAILMASCSRNIEGYAVDRAVRICKDHGGIHQIKDTDHIYVVCRDGTVNHSVGEVTPISEQPEPAALKIGTEDSPVAVWPIPLGPLIRIG